MDDNDENFDSPAAVREMRRRQAEAGRAMQRVGRRALEELERQVASGEITLSADAETLFRAGREMEQAALDGGAPKGSEETSTPLKKPN